MHVTANHPSVLLHGASLQLPDNLPQFAIHSSKPDDNEDKDEKEARRHKVKVLMSGLITAVGIALHNFPGDWILWLSHVISSNHKQ